ncbi:AAA family ATPase [Streptomyces sp. NPDC008092]|uniref:helix-turn-helix transcriptional regulator n=1 Tax=Streptomyces sp. NPDC008092 TaxID=3364808 RepID=UPI0036E415EC
MPASPRIQGSGVPVKLGERDEELRLLEQLHKGCVNGSGAVVLVSGPVGCGKTALTQAFAERAMAQGGRFVSVTASAGERLYRLGLVEQLLEALRAAGMADDPFTSQDGAGRAQAGALAETGGVPFLLLQRISRAVTEFAAERPLVVCVDDVHFADEASLECLRHLIHRTDSAALLVVLTENSCHAQRGLVTLHSETLPLPYSRLIRLGPLGVDGVAAQLTARAGLGATTRETAELWTRTSGGNPLLLHALIEDMKDLNDRVESRRRAERGGPGPAPADPAAGATHAPVPGESFRHAFLRCLHRCDPALLATVRAIAVLGQSAAPALIGDLLGGDATSIRSGIAALHMAGLLSGVRFRHERARLAVLADIPAGELSGLRARAAELLHETGAPAVVVAEQLMAAPDAARAPWQPGILREAAREAMEDGDVGASVDYLRHASLICTDAGEEAEVTAELAEAQWLIDPAKALRHLHQLGTMVRAGLLDGPAALIVVKQHAWRGEFTQADDLLRIIEDRGAVGCDWDGSTPPPTAVRSDLALTRLWLSFCCPGQRHDATPAAAGTGPEPPEPAGAGPALSPATPVPPPAGALPRAFLALAAGLTGDDETVPAAGRAPRGSRVDSPFAATLFALGFLVRGRRMDEAVFWSERLLAEPWNLRIPMRRALLETIRSAAALRRGDLTAAGEAARTALSLAAPEAWGVAIGLPVALAVCAATELGDHETAMTYLELPVPTAMFGTPFALPYLHALGHHHLAMERPRTALLSFESCAELVVKWQLDFPELIDWRNDVAAALVAVGDDRRARALIQDHLSRLGDGGSRARGIALRHLAAISRPEERLPLLQESIRILDACGDRLELDRARAARSGWGPPGPPPAGQLAPPRLLGLASGLWDLPQERPHTRHAQRTQDSYDPQHTHDRHDPPGQPHREEPEARAEPPVDAARPHELPELLTELTEAERRVGALAASGWTNRRIADVLFITVSTVEQHLTKVYRKLKVRNRADLPVSLIRFADLPFSTNGGR